MKTKKIFISIYMIIVNIILSSLLFNYNIEIIKYIYSILLLVFTLESLEVFDFENLTIENVYNKLFSYNIKKFNKR